MANDDEDLIQQLLAQLAASAPGANNSILAGAGTLIRTMIQSPNYVPGVSGWTINKDGSAEFNNLTVRGQFLGTNFIINTHGIFFYSPTEATGNLVLAIAPAAGTDSFGNAYPQGILIADPAIMLFPSGQSFENNTAFIQSAFSAPAVNQFLQLLLSGPSTTTAGARDLVLIELNSAAKDNSSNANGELNYQGSNGALHEYAFWDSSGFNCPSGANIVAPHPGTIPAVAETWTTLSLINSYAAGTNNGFIDVPQVRLMADNKTLMFKGTLACPATGAATVWSQIPANYPNANLGGILGMLLVANLSGGTVDHIELHNNGNLGLQNAHNSINFDISGIMTTQ